MKRKPPKSKGGRPSKGVLYESIRQAASATGRPLDVLKAAKAEGCPAFKAGGRVHGGELSEWLAAHPDVLKVKGTPKEESQRRISEIKAARVKWELERDQGEYLKTTVARQTLTRMATECKTMFWSIGERHCLQLEMHIREQVVAMGLDPDKFPIKIDSNFIRTKLQGTVRAGLDKLANPDWPAQICPYCQKIIETK